MLQNEVSNCYRKAGAELTSAISISLRPKAAREMSEIAD